MAQVTGVSGSLGRESIVSGSKGAVAVNPKMSVLLPLGVFVTQYPLPTHDEVRARYGHTEDPLSSDPDSSQPSICALCAYRMIRRAAIYGAIVGALVGGAVGTLVGWVVWH